jgi:hypothetical protein
MVLISMENGQKWRYQLDGINKSKKHKKEPPPQIKTNQTISKR